MDSESNCDCKNVNEGITILKGKGSFLKLIRAAAPVKSETEVTITPDMETTDTEVTIEKEIPEEDLMRLKRLDYILRKIEKLRYASKEMSN